MPEGTDETPNIPEENSERFAQDASLDGITPPQDLEDAVDGENEEDVSEEGVEEEEEVELSDEEIAAIAAKKKQLLLYVFVGGGALLLTTFIFAFYLMGSLPDPTGGSQQLRQIGNMYFGIVAVVPLLLIGLLFARLKQSEMEPEEIMPILVRPGIGAVVLIGLSTMVLVVINQQVPLPIDILEPTDLNGITAPVQVTFGTHELRSILRNQGLAPRRYKWDFNGDGVSDADTTDQEVTTTYSKRGKYYVNVVLYLSNGKTRVASALVNIPRADFFVTPEEPILNNEITFDVSNLLVSQGTLKDVTWDFNGDNESDVTVTEPICTHTFTEAGTFTITALLQYEGGLQEQYSRVVKVVEEAPQPFDLSITSDSPFRGSVPLGIVFNADIEEGVITNTIDWTIINAKDVKSNKGKTGVEKSGESISYVFSEEGEYVVSLRVTDSRGRVGERSVTIEALEPLQLKDIVLGGSPKPARGKIEGVAPLEVRLTASTKTPFITFRWEQENADAVYSVQDDYHAVYEKEGIYPVVLIATDELDRSQKTFLDITVLSPRSSVAFDAVPATGIAPLNVTFDASDSFVPDGRITGFSWTFGDAGKDEKEQLLGAKVTHRFESEGKYVVIVRALTEDGRSFNADKTIVVRSPTLNSCIYPSRTEGSAPMGVRFDASCSAGIVTEYHWDFGDGTTEVAVEAIQDHIFTKPGQYTVTLEVTDGQGNFNQSTVSISVVP